MAPSFLHAAEPSKLRVDFHNPAIGGFESPNVIRTDEYEFFPWYPALIVFDVYEPV